MKTALLNRPIIFLIASLIAGTASAFDARPLHPTIRDRLGPIRIVVALPKHAGLYQPNNPNLQPWPPAYTSAPYDASHVPAGGQASAAIGSAIGTVLANYAIQRAYISMYVDGQQMLELIERLSESRGLPQHSKAQVDEALRGVDWTGGATSELVSGQSDAEILNSQPTQGGATMIVHLAPAFSIDGRQMVLFGSAALYHPELGPEFTLYKRGKKRWPVPWQEAALVSTPLLRSTESSWTPLPKTDADRAVEAAEINHWFETESAGVGKVTREKLDIERRKRLHATEGNLLSLQSARARTLAAWEADGGVELAARYDAMLSALLPMLVEALGKSDDAGDDPIELISK